MPLNNNLSGIFKTLQVAGGFVLASEASDNVTMDVKAVNFIQGTPKNRIMDIGGLSEQIDITAPILVGGAAKIDGRNLLASRLANILNDPEHATLPLLKSASITINQQGTNIALGLISDGDPNIPDVFEVTDYTAEALTDGINTDILNPTGPGGPTRLARFYDFRVCLAGFIYYVMDAKLLVDIETTDNYFLGGKDGSTSNSNPVNLVLNFGTQYPTIAISSIKISGSGKAAVSLKNLNPGSDHDYKDFNTEGGNQDESINAFLGAGQSPVTLQSPGLVKAVDANFAIQIYNGSSWVDLIDNSIVDLSKSVVSKYTFRIEPGMMTADFAFNCWVR